MANNAQFDKNLEVPTTLGRDDICLYNAAEAPFTLHGLFLDNGVFARVPAAVAETVSEGVAHHARNAAGGRTRFKTDSPFVAIVAKMPFIGRMPHFALTGSSGFALYIDGVFVKTFIPPFDMKDGYESLLELPVEREPGKMHDVTIVWPTYSTVSSLYVGVQKGAQVLPPEPYKYDKPVVYYGSSITQGGCSSQPGNTYEDILSRWLNTEYINLGFSGNAKGEPEMVEYINNLDMSVLVMDYDHNAPSIEHLQATHEPMYKAIRERHPDLPIIMISMPKNFCSPGVEKRKAIIRATYENAAAAGDKNVYFIDGCDFFKILGEDSCTVDSTHPNDLGFMAMALGIRPVLEPLLK